MKSPQPNILVIQADQLAAAALPIYGGRAVTPNLSRLASQGMVFDNFYCNFPLCGPSRMSMLTGRLASDVEVYDNASDLSASIPTVAHFLRRARYHTSLSGKMHFVGPDQLHGFEERLTAEIYPADFAWLPDWETGKKGFEPMRNTIENGGVCAWNMQIAFDEEATHKAVGKLFDYARRPDQRFFLFTSLSHPHHPFLIQPEYWEKYGDDDIPGPSVDRLPDHALDPHSRRCRKMIGLLDEGVSDHHSRQARHGYYGAISYFDDKLGQILNALEASGLSENTAIFVTADHGEMLGERGLWGKDCFFEWAMRIPLIVKVPHGPANARTAEIASLVDLLPTFSQLAGQQISTRDYGLAGRSLAEIILGTGGRSQGEVLAEYTADATNESMVMIRSGNYKYIASKSDPELLYNLDADPSELHNIAGEASEGRMLADFEVRLRSIWNLSELDEKIKASQRERKLVSEALKLGQKPNWDFMPTPDYSDTYVRSANSHEVIDRKVRIPARGYELPRNY